MIDPYFHRFIGKVLIHVADEAEAQCRKQGLSFSVLDKTFPRNIDVDHKRLNFRVDEESIIREIFRG